MNKRKRGLLDRQAYLLLAFAVLFWSINAVLGRAIRDEVPPIGLSFWRWALATVFILPFAWKHTKNDFSTIRKHLGLLLFLSFLGVGTFNTLLYTGLQYTQAVNAVLLQTLGSAIVLLYSRLFFKVALIPMQVLGVSIAFLGAATIIFEGSLATLMSFRFNPGDLIVVIAVALYAGYTVFLQKRPKIHPLSFILATFVLGIPMILPFYIWESLTIRPVSLSQTTLLSFLYVGIFPSILSYIFYNRGVALIGPNRAGLFAYLMPVFGSILSILLLGEVFKWYHLSGSILILVGVFIATRIAQRKTKKSLS